MSVSAKPGMPSNEGQTDKDRGSLGSLPVGTMHTPNGRSLSRKGSVGSTSNDNSPESVHRRVPGRGAALNGLSEG